MHISVAETIGDCRAIIAWLKKNQPKDFSIIALSLESLTFLKSGAFGGRVMHIWDVLPMEDIVERGYKESLQISERWIAEFHGRSDNLYEIASQGALHLEVLMHSTTAILVAEALAENFKKNNTIYLAPPAQFSFYGSYFPNLQAVGRNNFLFKSVLLELLDRQKSKYISISQVNSITLKHLSWLRRWMLIKKIAYDLLETFRSKLSFRATIGNMLQGAINNVRLLTSGWGRDLSRSLSYELMWEKLKSAGISHLDLIWRPKKIFLPQKTTSDKQYILVRENVVRGVGYGPQLSMFPVKFWIQYIKFFSGVLRPRIERLTTFFPYQGLRELFAYNVTFAYREVFMTRSLLLHSLAKTSPTYFLGSDSAGASARAELLTAREKGIRTLSTPHGYQGYSMPLYSYLSDTVLTHSQGTGKILEATGLPKERIAVIGSSHLRRSVAPAINPSKVRVVIGTRSWGGFWTNFCSRHDAYDSELRLLATEMLKNPKFDTVIKSHPNGDYHEYYDFLVQQMGSPAFRHVPKGWKVEQFAESTDILVCFGEMPSLYISALYLKIPIVFISGTMTKTQAGLNYDYQGLGCVVKTASEAAEQITKLAADPSYYAEVMARQNKFAADYDMNEPEERIVEIINS